MTRPNRDGERSFDISRAVETDLRMKRPRTLAKAAALSALAVLLIVTGVNAGFLQRGPNTYSSAIEGSLLIATGVAIILSVWRYVLAVPRPPLEIVISGDALVFGDEAKAPTIRILWDDPALRLVIVDRSRLPVISTATAESLRYYVGPEGGFSAPIPKEAFDLILSQIERHGLTVRAQAFGPVSMLTVSSH